jgi:hypothetical protein
VKISDICSCIQELIGGGEVHILLIKVGPLRCLIPIGLEHDGECSHGRSTEVVSDTIFSHFIILFVEMELLWVGGPLLMVVILQIPLCIYELQKLVISVDDCLLSQDVMFPLLIGLYNGIHFIFIGGVFLNNISNYLTMVCYRMTVLCEKCAYNIVICINLSLKWLFQFK